MARTAPVPNIPPIPGMCPSLAVLAGGGDGGSGSGKGAGDGDGSADGSGDGSGTDASGDGKDGGTGCGDPVCPITGRVFVDYYDFGFAGPLPFQFIRSYNSRTSNKAADLGHGWSHTLGWRMHLRRTEVIVWDDKARMQRFAIPSPGEESRNGLAWALSLTPVPTLRLPEGQTMTFGPFDREGVARLATLSDRNGNAITAHRDGRGVLTGITDSAGRPYRVASDPSGRITSIAVATTPAADQWMEVGRYTYDDRGDLVSAIDAEGFDDRYAYAGHLVVEHRTPSGFSFFYVYDGADKDARCVESWGEYPGKPNPALYEPIPPRPEGADTRKVKGTNWIRLTYQPEQRYSEVENGLGGVDRYFGDEAGRIVKHVSASGGVIDRAFDPETGALAGTVDPADAATTMTSDADGNPTSHTTKAGVGTVLFQDAQGAVVSFDERTKSFVRERYDTRANLQSVELPDGTVESFANDERGLLTRMIRRDGSVVRYVHDPMGNCIRVDHADGTAEVSEYDYLGRRVVHVDRLGRRTQWAYDRRSEVVLKRMADGSETRAQHDANRKIVWMSEAGRVTKRVYAGIGWLVQQVEPSGATTEYRYDVEGNVVWVQNARGQVYRQTFDHAGRCRKIVTFEGEALEAAYDGADRRIWLSLEQGKRRTYEYDEAGRIVGLSNPDGTGVEAAHGPVGALKIVAGKIAIERELDPVGQLVREKQGAHETRVEWAGGSVDHLESDVGPDVDYFYGVSGDYAGLRVGSATLFDRRGVGPELPAGCVDAVTVLDDRLSIRRTLDPLGRLTRVAVTRASTTPEADGLPGDPGALFVAEYAYDASQHLVGESRADGTRIDWEHDVDGHILTRSLSKGGKLVLDERVGYDACGTPRVAGAQYDAMARPVALGGETFSYDRRGQLVERKSDAGTTRYVYDDFGDLVRVEAPKHSVDLAYDGVGRLVEKRVTRDGALTKRVSYVWANNVILREVDELGGRVRTYLRNMHEWVPYGHVDTLRDGTETHVAYVVGPAGTVDAAFDAAGTLVWSAQRTIYGEAYDVVGSAEVSVRFANQHADDDVGLVYNFHRWYDPRVGLYVSPDPRFLDGTFNPRDYAPNPHEFEDPLGLAKKKKNPPQLTNSNNLPADSSWDGKPASVDDVSLHEPGPWATNGTDKKPGFVTATGKARTSMKGISKADRDAVDAAGRAYGCHSCGRTPKEIKAANPQWKGHFIPDHQPPKSAVKAADKKARKEGKKQADGQVHLYPHCPNCASKQGGQCSAQSKASKGRSKSAQQAESSRVQNAETVMAVNEANAASS